MSNTRQDEDAGIPEAEFEAEMMKLDLIHSRVCGTFPSLQDKKMQKTINGIYSRIDDMFKFILRFLLVCTENDADSVLKCLDLCCYVAKNKRNRSKMVSNRFITAGLHVFKTFFPASLKFETTGDEMKVTLRAAVLLRCLARTKLGRGQLIDGNGLALFKQSIQDCINRETTSSEMKDLENIICSLCLRCIPLKPLPVDKPYLPIRFDLKDSSDCRRPAEECSESDEDTVLEPGKGPDFDQLLAVQLHNWNLQDQVSAEISGRRKSDAKTSIVAQLHLSAPKRDDRDLENYRKFCAEFGERLGPLDEKLVYLVRKTQEFVKRTDDQINKTKKVVINEPEKPASVGVGEQEHRATMRRSARSTIDFLKKEARTSGLKSRCSSEQKFNREFFNRRMRNTSDPHPESLVASPLCSLEGSFADLSDGCLKIGRSSSSQDVKMTEEEKKYEEEKRRKLLHYFYGEKEYYELSKTTKRIMPLVKLAYPDYVASTPVQGLHVFKEFRKSLLHNVLAEVKHFDDTTFTPRVVYDLDELILKEKAADELLNNDEKMLGQLDPQCDHLRFESRFESGNLRKVIQVGPREYELILSNDINQIVQHYLWFYFQVSNMECDVPYVFKIVNMVKSKSLVSLGMQPCMFSVSEALHGRCGWVRCGDLPTYSRNSYLQPACDHPLAIYKQNAYTERCFNTSTFVIAFQYTADICYMALHYPYTFSALKANIVRWQKLLSDRTKTLQNGPGFSKSPFIPGILFRKDVLGHSLAGNPIYLLTVTAQGTSEQIMRRDVIFLSSRVHPGESNSSWMMQGTIDFLLSDDEKAQQARDSFVFKLVPMLNPDGVINGHHRCSLAGQDLNRQYIDPDPKLHPCIYHVKNLLLFLRGVGKQPLLYCDYHGHSRNRNVFMYGTNPQLSWRVDDHNVKHDYSFYLLPEILDDCSPCFNLKYCDFKIQRGKESSGRVCVWRQLGIDRSYTMEASYGGFDKGMLSGFQLGIREAMEMGVNLIEGLVTMREYIQCDRMPTRKFETSESDSDDSGMAWDDNMDLEKSCDCVENVYSPSHVIDRPPCDSAQLATINNRSASIITPNNGSSSLDLELDVQCTSS